MFTFMNPVENYIKEIRVPCKLEPNERVTTLPFVFESRPSSRVHSAHSPEMMSSSSTFLHPFARRQEIPAVKKQLHREIVYFFGCNKEVLPIFCPSVTFCAFSRNKAAEKYYKDLHTVGISGNLENEASRQLYRYNDSSVLISECSVIQSLVSKYLIRENRKQRYRLLLLFTFRAEAIDKHSNQLKSAIEGR
uniref:Uncharacterized protein n=1 Tax=Magallana gigas TaxID=29159 RepID=K1QYQ6_MAGGI